MKTIIVVVVILVVFFATYYLNGLVNEQRESAQARTIRNERLDGISAALKYLELERAGYRSLADMFFQGYHREIDSLEIIGWGEDLPCECNL